MPTITTVTLENLVEPTVQISLKKPLNSVDEPTNELPDPSSDPNPNPRHLYISPALYVTPEQAPIADHSSIDPVTPSPYVVNHKRRLLLSGNEFRSEVPDLPLVGGSSHFRMEEDEDEDVGDNFVNNNILVDDDNVDDDVDIEEEARKIDTRSFVSSQAEFFDAIDDFSSDGSISNTPSSGYRIESELHCLRLSLREEIERRNTAEQTVMLMRCQWERISNLMSQAGFTFPAPPTDGDSMQLDNNLMDQFCQEVVVSRFVSESIGRGEARAEAEEAAAKILELKDQEILRLRDRLQYFETVNHEMSQRKLVEVARRQQGRKMRRRRWIWSVMGLSIATSVSLVAYSVYKGAPTSKYLPLLKSGDSKTS